MYTEYKHCPLAVISLRLLFFLLLLKKRKKEKRKKNTKIKMIQNFHNKTISA